MLSLNSMIPMSYHYLWASTITTINTSPHGQGDTCGWPANMDQIEHSPIWKGLRLHHSRAYVFFLAYHCLVFLPCWRGYFTHTLSCNTLRESCLPSNGSLGGLMDIIWPLVFPWSISPVLWYCIWVELRWTRMLWGLEMSRHNLWLQECRAVNSEDGEFLVIKGFCQ